MKNVTLQKKTTATFSPIRLKYVTRRYRFRVQAKNLWRFFGRGWRKRWNWWKMMRGMDKPIVFAFSTILLFRHSSLRMTGKDGSGHGRQFLLPAMEEQWFRVILLASKNSPCPVILSDPPFPVILSGSEESPDGLWSGVTERIPFKKNDTWNKKPGTFSQSC